MSGSFTAYVDGACSGNPGPGGWGVVVFDQGGKVWGEFSGGESATTNNRMEMMAAIRALEALPDIAAVTIYSDSQVLVRGATGRWKRKANKDLWGRIEQLCKGRRIVWRWVKGHSGDWRNDRADALAKAGIGKTFGGDAPAVSDPCPIGELRFAGGKSLVVGLDGSRVILEVKGNPKTKRLRLPVSKAGALASLLLAAEARHALDELAIDRQAERFARTGEAA